MELARRVVSGGSGEQGPIIGGAVDDIAETKKYEQ